MGYVVLARRWRPQRFEDVLAQRHVTRTLQNAISMGRVAHAFLFSGPRGVGKTTVARILAKALNCREGPTPTPCCRCDVCEEIAAGVSTDVHEIDGASNTGVDDVRDLRENILYRPSKGGFKIYIIDEVHMLSNAAFNALLKTLEEPPSHVKFIFATTEPQKIPPTILSRCQKFEFKRIPRKTIVDQLKTICRSEGIEASEEVLRQIAAHAQGSLRDSQSLLDQVISYAGQKISEEDLAEVLGVFDRQWVLRTTQCLLNRDARGCLSMVEELFQHGFSLTYFYHQMVEHLRNLMVVKYVEDGAEFLNISNEELEELRVQAALIDVEDLHLWFDVMVGAEEEMRRSQYPRYVLEMVLLKMATLDRVEDLGAIVERVSEITGYPAKRSKTQKAPPTATQHSEDREVQKAAHDPQRLWECFLEGLRRRRPAMASILEQGTPKGFNEGGEMVVALPSQFHVELIGRGDHQREIRELFKEIWGRDGGVQPVLEQEGARQNQESRPNRHMMRMEARSHPLVQEALELFQGRLVDIVLPEEGGASSSSVASGGRASPWDDGTNGGKPEDHLGAGEEGERQ
jgi:DNA polymerase-3 subunit gamma/tau